MPYTKTGLTVNVSHVLIHRYDHYRERSCFFHAPVKKQSANDWLLLLLLLLLFSRREWRRGRLCFDRAAYQHAPPETPYLLKLFAARVGGSRLIYLLTVKQFTSLTDKNEQKTE